MTSFVRNRGWRRVLAACLAPVLAGCGARPAAPARPAAETFRVERRDLQETRREDGRLQAARIFSFFPEVGDAELQAVHVKEGDEVPAGHLLFTFDTGPAMADLRALQARTNALARQAALADLRADDARQAAEAARAEAAQAAATAKDLAARGLASQADREKAERAAARAELAVRIAGAGAGGAAARPAEVEELEVQRLQAVADLGRAQRRLDESLGRAPFAGRVLRVNDAVKEFSPDPGKLAIRFQPSRGPLLILADVREMRAVARFFEGDAARIRPGHEAVVRAEHVPGREFKGQVSTVGQLGYSHGQNSTVVVESRVDNAEGLLKHGLTAEVEIVVARKAGVLAIPLRCLHRAEGRDAVWRIRGGERERVGVTTGISDETHVEIVSGLAEGDEIAAE